MMDYLRDIISLSNTDPLWVTALLGVARSVALGVVLFWVAGMIRGQGRNALGPRIPLTWTWALVGWMIANALQLIVSVVRVLIVGHVRAGDPIGDAYRMVEIAVAISLALWSIVAFWRWAHPLAAVSDEGAFSSLATSFPIIVTDSAGVIQLTTPALDRMLGADEDELLGQNVTVIIPEQWREMHTKGMIRYLKTGESRLIGRVVQIDILRRDGTEAPASIALSSAQVDGETWFIGAMWERMEEQVHSPAQVARDEAREREETKVEQAATRTEQAATEIRQTAEKLRQGVVSAGQDDRQVRQDDREGGLDVRADEADRRGQQQDSLSREQSKERRRLEGMAMDDVILKTSADVEDVKEDVHEVKKKVVEEDAP